MGKNDDVTLDDLYKMLAGELLPSDIEKRREAKRMQKVYGRRQNQLEEELSALNVRELLSLRRDIYYRYSEWEKTLPMEYIVHALYKVLATKPHVPNKVEGERLRRKAATTHHGPKKQGGSKYKQPVKISARRKAQMRKKLPKWQWGWQGCAPTQ